MRAQRFFNYTKSTKFFFQTSVSVELSTRIQNFNQGSFFGKFYLEQKKLGDKFLNRQELQALEMDPSFDQNAKRRHSEYSLRFNYKVDDIWELE